MAINKDRPTITYENIAMLMSSEPAYSATANSGQNVSFLPLVQSIDVSFDIPRNNAGQVGSKKMVNKGFQNAPDVNLSISTYEDFSELFSRFTAYVNESAGTDLDVNFYAVLGDKTSRDIGKEGSLDGKQVLSFGNCFLNEISMSQSVNGLIQSTYNFLGSNIQAQILEEDQGYFTGEVPALNLVGDQSQGLIFKFDELSADYYNTDGSVIPSFSTNILISGENSFGNFLINSESVQSFDLSLPINRKTIYSLGKKHALKRKKLFPSVASLTFSNKTENFHVDGDRSNLDDFLDYDESYDIYLSGAKNNADSFLYKIEDAKLATMNLSNSIGSNAENSFSFFFDVIDFRELAIIGYEVSESEILGGAYNGTYVIGEPTGSSPGGYSTAYYYGDYIIGRAYPEDLYLSIYYLDVIGDADGEIISFTEEGVYIEWLGLVNDENVIITPIYG